VQLSDKAGLGRNPEPAEVPMFLHFFKKTREGALKKKRTFGLPELFVF
jgi:hypothetical protein